MWVFLRKEKLLDILFIRKLLEFIDPVTMKLIDCKNCEFHKGHLTDSILCKYENFMEHRIVDRDKVISCPKEEKKK